MNGDQQRRPEPGDFETGRELATEAISAFSKACPEVTLNWDQWQELHWQIERCFAIQRVDERDLADRDAEA